MVGRIYECKKEEVAGGWRKVHNEELHDLYPLPNIIRVTKSRKMRWVGQTACLGEKKNFVWET
jgi:hypothetical protein